ncbi:hypothetical protein ACH5RR_026358 [Cinchona calisaya]|uniref:DOG1 domain-containing protein n=1 Tax=Cinchona calisaya TaxID=153742 RepID=A0ABD2Z492_9GENT
MATTAENQTEETEENFQQFYEKWKTQQNQHLQELITASEHAPTNETMSTHLSNLVKSVVEHYEEYYKAKSKWAEENILLMLSPPWTSSLENAFLWIGGWRPTMAIHLLYSKSGLQLEAKFSELIQGLLTKHDLGDLSPSQLSRVDELQRKTINEEKEITEKMAKQQEKAADADTVELSHLVSEAMREGGANERNREAEENQVESTLHPKEEGFKKILDRADNLRLKTLRSIIEIFSPVQAVHFLIAAAELHLRIHEWGKAKDERQLNGGVGHPISQQQT